MPTYSSYSGELLSSLAEMRAKGQKEAAAHRPTTDSSHLDEHQAALQAEAEKWFATEQGLYDMATTEASRTATEIRQKAIELEARMDQLLSDDTLKGRVDADLAAEREAIISRIEQRMRAEVDWKHFRHVNGIQRDAEYPESLVWHFGIVAVLALIECVINAFFYENTQGLLGGFMVALSVSVVNMCAALVLGWGFRQKNLTERSKRIIGWSSLIFFVLFSLYCNALFASFRSEYQLLSDPGDPLQLRQAFAKALAEAGHLFTFHFRFADLMSFILFCFGFLLTWAAFYKGYTVDDPYPGYKRKDARFKETRQAEMAAQDALRQKIKELLERLRNECRSITHEPAQLISQAGRRLAEVRDSKSQLEMRSQAIQREFGIVLRGYRDANTAVRAADPPLYFREIPDLTGRLNWAAGDAAISTLDRLQQDVKALGERRQEALTAKLKALQEESASVLNDRFGQFLKAAGEEAQENINRMTPTIHRLA